MINLTSVTTTNPLTRIRNHFSSVVNGSISPYSRKEVTVKEFATFLGVETATLFRTEEGVVYEIPPAILDAFSVYLAKAWKHNEWSRLMVWFSNMRENPKQYKQLSGSETTDTDIKTTNTVDTPYRFKKDPNNVYGVRNPLWEEVDSDDFNNARSYLSLLWELHVLDSLNAAEYPWINRSQVAINDLLNNPAAITPIEMTAICQDITLENGRDVTSHAVASIIKMSPWPIDKYLKNKMNKVPKQFVSRLKYWSLVQLPGPYANRRQIILDNVDSVLKELNDVDA